MRRDALTILIASMIGGLMVVVTGQVSNAQEFRKALVTGMFRSIAPDLPEDTVKSMVVELAKDEELRKRAIPQLIREVITVIGPENMKDIVKSAAAELGDAFGFKMRLDRAGTADLSVDSLRAPPSSVAGELIKYPDAMNALKSRGPVADPQALRSVLHKRMVSSVVLKRSLNPEGIAGSKNLRNPIGAIIHPLNPVDTLTDDQIRKLFSGEYTNWSQVGGADLPVRLITLTDARPELEALLDTDLAPGSVKVPFLSFLFVGVAETEGAIGVLLDHNMEQLDAVKGYRAIKKIGIKKNSRSRIGLLVPEP